MQNESEYQKAIRLEEEWWGKKLPPHKPDYRLRELRRSPQATWDDPEIEDLTRGAYIDRLLHPSKSKGLRILELGCGTGWLALELARQGHHVDACDIARNRIELAKSYYAEVKAKEKGLGEINYYTCDLNKIELPRDAYDFVICWDSLHHVLEIRRLIRQVLSCLKTGGKFLGYDHIGQQSRLVCHINLLAFCVFTLFSDTRTLARLVSRKIRRLFSRGLGASDKREDEVMMYSPFEAVTGREMIDCLVETFGEEHVVCETTMAFGVTWFAKIRCPHAAKLAIISFLKKIDDYLIRRGIVEGESAFMQAAKV